MARRRNSSAADLIDLIALLPWWLGAILGIASYLVLHRYAIAELPTPHPSQFHQLAGPSMFKAFAMAGQYVLPFLCFIGAVTSAWKRRQRRQLLDTTAANPAAALNAMSWKEFELLVGEAFRRQGYAVTENAGHGPDGGVDLLLTKGGERFLVQCKQWRAVTVGVTVVRELYGVMAASGATGGYVVTSGRFTTDAVKFAEGRNVELIDGEKLSTWIRTVRPFVNASGADQVEAKQSRTSAPAAAACPKCGGLMVERMAKKGSLAGQLFWGCQNYPKCRGMRPSSR